MSKPMKVRLSPSARSVVDVDIVEGYDPEIDSSFRAVILDAYADGVLTLPEEGDDRERLYLALTEFANDCDEMAEDATHDPDVRALHRAARTSLTTAASKVLRAFMDATR